VPPERDLAILLRDMAPLLAPELYVYCSFPDHRLPNRLDALCLFREVEGLTAIVNKADAEAHQLPFTFESRLITLEVNSDLAAVGFLSAICAALARARISCNAVSAYYHDHLLVPAADADRAMLVLRAMANGSIFQ
jgi:hypothetical protein